MSTSMTGLRLDSPLDSFPSERSSHATPALDHPSLATSVNAPDGPPPVDTTVATVAPKRKGGWLTVGAVVILFLAAVPAALGVTALVVAAPLALVWTAYDGLVRSVVRTQDVLIDLEPAARLILFGLWLGLVSVLAVVVVRGWDLATGRGGVQSTDSVLWALSVAAASVLVSVALTSWIVWWLLGYFVG